MTLEVVKEIYSEARSRAIHGSTDRHGHDWQRTRSMAERLARLCLSLSCEWIWENQGSDDLAALRRPDVAKSAPNVGRNGSKRIGHIGARNDRIWDVDLSKVANGRSLGTTASDRSPMGTGRTDIGAQSGPRSGKLPSVFEMGIIATTDIGVMTASCWSPSDAGTSTLIGSPPFERRSTPQMTSFCP